MRARNRTLLGGVQSVVILALLVPFALAAETLSELARRYNFDKNQNVGIEIEFIGLALDKTAHALADELGGVLKIKLNTVDGIDSTGKIVKFSTRKFKVNGTSVGQIIVKFEDNGFNNKTFFDHAGKSRTIEIVSPPMREHELAMFDRGIRKIESLGAIGTAGENPVSLQINVEIAGAAVPKRAPSYLIKLIRDYFSEPNYSIIQSEWNVPRVRMGYVGRPSEGLLKRLRSPNYHPRLRQFYDDVMYRQAYEMLIDESQAWTLKIEVVRKAVLAFLNTNSFEAALRVYKWNDIKLTSLMMYWFPNDPLSQLLDESTWFKPIPAIEFRAPNNDFNTIEIAARVLALVEAARQREPLVLDAEPTNCESYLLKYRYGFEAH